MRFWREMIPWRRVGVGNFAIGKVAVQIRRQCPKANNHNNLKHMKQIASILLMATLATASAGAQITTNWTRDARPVQARTDASLNRSADAKVAASAPRFTIVKGSEALNAPVGEPLAMTSYLTSRSDSLYFITWGTNVGMARYTDRVGDILIGSDGSFYFKDPIMRQRIGTWLKGTLKDGVVSFTLPQALAYAQFEDGSQTRLLANVIERDSNTFVPVAGENVVRFSWDGDSLRQLDPTVKIGMVLESNGGWTGYADWDMQLAVQRDKPTTYTGYADALDYGMSGFDYNFLYNQTLAFGVKLRMDGNKLIICDLPSAPAGSVVEGRIDGNTVTIPKQYMGIDSVNMCHVYFQPLYQHLRLEGRDLYADEHCTDTYTLTLDRDSMTLHAAADNAYSINCGKDVKLTIDTRGMLHNARFKPFDRNRPATPLNAQVYMYSNANPAWGFACFAHPMMDKDCNYVDPEQMYYRVYMDDTLQNLDAKVYVGIDSINPTVTDIPFTLNNGANLFSFNWNYMHQISTFRGWKKLGIQVVYKAGGQERVSDIFYSDQTVVPSAVRVISGADKEIVDSVYYDLTGRRIAEPEHGLYIRVDRYSDGTTRSVKTIR